ncbi:putative receptor expression-enhancing protein 5 isoform X1 [Apostichopus japonicus]|uniref:Putative receptor expression-enhancing protein 5 isoform X1 n=1 Tax=Stichopus japonicus TaxID=307972 RepID=A0A2G8JTM7_STIJA|nr:putative receptor expression-enhancing protein 5 isoform X1 [Apostichopus japonicus]
MIFLGWCMAPIESNGSNILYHRFIKPFVLKHEKEIDDSLGKVTDLASATLNEGEEKVEEVEVEEFLPSLERHESGDDYNSDSSSDYSVALTDPQISSHDGELSDSEGFDRSDQGIIGVSEEVNEGNGVSELQSCSLKEEPPPSPNYINSPGGVDVSSSERVEIRNTSHEFETTSDASPRQESSVGVARYTIV